MTVLRQTVRGEKAKAEIQTRGDGHLDQSGSPGDVENQTVHDIYTHVKG